MTCKPLPRVCKSLSRNSPSIVCLLSSRIDCYWSTEFELNSIHDLCDDVGLIHDTYMPWYVHAMIRTCQSMILTCHDTYMPIHDTYMPWYVHANPWYVHAMLRLNLLHVEKLILNLVELNKIWIEINIFKLIWQQTIFFSFFYSQKHWNFHYFPSSIFQAHSIFFLCFQVQFVGLILYRHYSMS